MFVRTNLECCSHRKRCLSEDRQQQNPSESSHQVLEHLSRILLSLSELLGAWRVFFDVDRGYFAGTARKGDCLQAHRKSFQLLEMYYEKLRNLEGLAKTNCEAVSQQAWTRSFDGFY